MAIHHDIQEALLRAAQRRRRDTARRRDAQANAFGADEYHHYQTVLDKTKFIQPVDADTTQVNLYHIKKKFARFCIKIRRSSWKSAIRPQTCSKGFIMSFLHWICETYVRPRRKRTKKKTINQYWRDFKMLYRRENDGQVVNPNDCEEIRKYINDTLKVEYDLDDTPKSKPVLGVDDLLLGLTQHWSRDQSVFPTEDDRLDVSTIMLFQAYTACRPAELVDGTKSIGAKDPILDDRDTQDTLEGGTAALSMGTGRNLSKVSKSKVKGTGPAPAQPLCRVKSEDSGDSELSTLDDDVFSVDSGSTTSDTELMNDSEDDDFIGVNDGMLGYENFTAWQNHTVPQRVSGEYTTLDTTPEYGPVRKHKALCYEDIVLWIVKDPNRGERDVLAMEVLLRHHKGADRKPKPTIFLFRENPLPILCPIAHILARAIRDNAVEVQGYDRAAPFFSTQLGRTANKVNWKPSILKTPVFRRSVRTASGGWVKSESDPMKYSAYALYLDRIGSDLGSEEKWTSYCMRRGNANTLLEVAPNAVVDQVMRHDPMTGCLANAYLNCRVGFNTQDAYLERDPSADGLTRAFTHMSIRCNPEVPKEIPRAELAKLPTDPEVERLRKQVKLLGIELRQKYRFIKSAPKQEQKAYKQLVNDRRAAVKAFKEDMTKTYQEAFRRRLHNEELERQLAGTVANDVVQPSIQHQLEERTHLQAILCDFNTVMSLKDITDRKIKAIDGMVRLAARREVRRARPQSVTPVQSRESSPIEEKRPELEFPLLLDKTQCIYCVGDEHLPYESRMKAFKRVSHMMDHVENVHLRHEKKGKRFVCRHPKCRPLGDFLASLEDFKAHAQLVHRIKLRA